MSTNSIGTSSAYIHLIHTQYEALGEVIPFLHIVTIVLPFLKHISRNMPISDLQSPHPWDYGPQAQ